MPCEGVGGESGLHRLHRHCYDPEYARMEAWLDEHPDFVQDYFLRFVHVHNIYKIFLKADGRGGI